MNCIICNTPLDPDMYHEPICDLCRDESPYAAERARMIAALREPDSEELEEFFEDWDY